jgi:hypothetical protein
VFANEATRRQFKYDVLLDRRIKTEIKVFQFLRFAEASELHPPSHLTFITLQQLILKQQLQEFSMRQPAACGFVKSNVKRAGKS